MIPINQLTGSDDYIKLCENFDQECEQLIQAIKDVKTHDASTTKTNYIR